MTRQYKQWTAEDFAKAVGREIENDDLDRCNCSKAGQPGHNGCGICEHDLPVFMCHECFPKCHR